MLIFPGKRVENSSLVLLEGTDEFTLNRCNLIGEVFKAFPEYYGVSDPSSQKFLSEVLTWT